MVVFLFFTITANNIYPYLNSGYVELSSTYIAYIQMSLKDN